jgi:hypothetical protein
MQLCDADKEQRARANTFIKVNMSNMSKNDNTRHRAVVYMQLANVKTSSAEGGQSQRSQPSIQRQSIECFYNTTYLRYGLNSSTQWSRGVGVPIGPFLRPANRIHIKATLKLVTTGMKEITLMTINAILGSFGINLHSPLICITLVRLGAISSLILHSLYKP